MPLIDRTDAYVVAPVLTSVFMGRTTEEPKYVCTYALLLWTVVILVVVVEKVFVWESAYVHERCGYQANQTTVGKISSLAVLL